MRSTPTTLTSRRKAAALPIALEALALFAVLAAALARLATIEKGASRSATDAVRARMAAHAGVERALAVRDEIRFGEVQVDRVTPEAGVCTPTLAGRAVRLPARATVEHLVTEAGAGLGPVRPEKYETDGSSSFTGRIPLESDRTRGAVLAWTSYVPPGWRIAWKAGTSSDPNHLPEVQDAAGGWARIDPARIAARDLFYRLEFVREGGPDAARLAPVVDEVTLVLPLGVRIVSWEALP